jgi:bifunctional ADP-heptose synthase (sugar kinase/adenylyltransferase)
MLERAENLLEACDLLIFADFNYGCLPTDLVRAIAQRAAGKGVLMVADSQSSSQSGDIARFRGMELITPTEREARLSMRDNESGLIVLAEALRQQSEARNVFLKIGEEGVIIHADVARNGEWLTDRIPALNKLPVDVAGAGDSMLVVSAMAMACGADIWEAAALGSVAAGVQVSRVGNVPITPEELTTQL